VQYGIEKSLDVSCIQQGARKGKAVGEPASISSHWVLRGFDLISSFSKKLQNMLGSLKVHTVHMPTAETKNTLMLSCRLLYTSMLHPKDRTKIKMLKDPLIFLNALIFFTVQTAEVCAQNHSR